MRILLATDGSESAAVARDLTASLPWPDGSAIRVVAVVERPVGVIPTPWLAPGPANLGELYDDLVRSITAALEAVERDLRRQGVTVDSVRREGRAATGIVDEARAFGADLVILGSRGHGPIASMLIGSTSSEVVDHAPCPVLVARRAAIGPILIADDGSPVSERAMQLLESWSPFADEPCGVLSVAEVAGPWIVGVAPTMYDDVLAAHAADVEAAREQATAIASAGAERLRKAGFRAEAITAEGDAAHRILEAAKARGSGLIVLGSRGRTGIVRAMLGSVARNVLLHADCSVMIVR
ncbi:MAG: universal stress protein [Chloroflexota bacterium]